MEFARQEELRRRGKREVRSDVSKLVIVVPESRASCGRAMLVGSDGRARVGPFRALATASRRVARKHGNATCDPLLPFGHPPSGVYAIAGSLPPGYSHPRRPRRFGEAGALLLAPREGDALRSVANGRRSFVIHGGPLDHAGRLRPTRGGIRVSDADMDRLVRAVNGANADDDPLEAVEVFEASAVDVDSVPATDLKGARDAVRQPVKGSASRVTDLVLLVVAGLAQTTTGHGPDAVDRRGLLRNVLLLVGGLTVAACSSQASPCTPLACDPSDGKLLRDGGRRHLADAAVGASRDAGDAGRTRPDGGRGHRVDCPPSGFVCEEDYVVGGGFG